MRFVSGLLVVATLVGNLLPALTSPAGAAVAAAPHVRKSIRRLPSDVLPISYELRLKPDLDAGTFSGSEAIKLKVSKPVTQILLNAKELNVTQATLTPATGGSAQDEKVETLADDEMILVANPGKTINPGEYVLHLNYEAKLNTKLVGLYKSTFKDESGKDHNLAVTQFEPADARRMMPCFDEPQMKAHFKISVETKPGYAAISNAPVEHESVEGNAKIVQFAETPPMSSYLVALVVGDFEGTPPVVVEGVPVRVWSVRGKTALGTYSRDEAAKILPVLTKYFQIPYPWKKLDLIAIPDFEAGAMENPGCITFRETLLLIDPKTASSPARRSASSVIAHEMAHLWFGDLVTMKWWDDLWLNEAFATWMSTRAVNTVHPDWAFWKGYVEDRIAALHTDSLHSTRAIHAPVLSPDQAHEMFDVITYEKGASVLRMLERYVGEENFQKGISKYLSEHAYSNATTGDLWDAVGAVSGDPVRKVMDGWVHQAGYPLLTIEHADNNVTVKQQRFFLAGETDDKTVWDVPVGVRPLDEFPAVNNQTKAKTKLLLSTPAGPFKLGADAPIFANAGGVGYYRTQYPAADAKAIRSKLESRLDPGERVTILDDTWNLAKAGHTPVQQYLDLLNLYRNDNDDTVWEEIIGSLNYLDRFVNAENRPAFERFIRQTLSSIHKQLGWDAVPGESQRRKILRGSVIGQLGTLGQDPEVIKKSRILVEQYLKDKTSVDPDLVGAVSEVVAYNGSASDYANFKRLYQTAKTPEDEHRNLYMLPLFSSPALYNRTMEMALNGTVRIQDAPNVLGMLLSRRQTNVAAWQFIQKNWPRITAQYSEYMVPHMVARAANFNTPEYYQQLKSFVATHPIPSSRSTVARMLEDVQINVGFRQRSSKSLNDWLRQHFGNS